jgi:hypothetical protein
MVAVTGTVLVTVVNPGAVAVMVTDPGLTPLICGVELGVVWPGANTTVVVVAFGGTGGHGVPVQVRGTNESKGALAFSETVRPFGPAGEESVTG